jgi:hypothetical protein
MLPKTLIHIISLSLRLLVIRVFLLFARIDKNLSEDQTIKKLLTISLNSIIIDNTQYVDALMDIVNFF